MQESKIAGNNGYNPLIELKDVSKSYMEENLTERSVLHEVNAVINKGEIIIVLGRSGSGKSTILNLLSGIDLPSKGSILIGSTDITKLSEQERTLFRRGNVGFVFQFFNLIPTLTAMENLMLPLELNGVPPEEGTKKAQNMLQEIGLSDRAKSYPDQLSGGEQQRIAIARALIHEPSIILADEPTGNLDYDTGLVIISLLDNLVRKKGKTMVMATHSREVIGLADRILTVKEGKIIEFSASKVE